MKAGGLVSKVFCSCLALTIMAQPALAAQPDNRDRSRSQRNGIQWENGWEADSRRDVNRQSDRDGRRDDRDDRRGREEWQGRQDAPRTVYRAPVQGRYNAPPERRRTYRNVTVVRPYGHWYRGYGNYNDDYSAFAWLGLTAITLTILNELNESQQRALETAQIHATTARVGQPIVWSNGAAVGQVIALREGQTLDGLYCREFQQSVTIGGRTEDAFGTACMQPDGSWQIVDQ